MRPPTAKFTPAMSCSDWNAPVTLTEMDLFPVWITPAGRTMFCACRAAIKDPRFIPRVASSRIENSMKICSS